MPGVPLWDEAGAELYDALGVAPDADDHAIQSAWRRAARRAHPDAGGTDESFRAVHIAYLVLSDPEQRSTYDRSRTPTSAPTVDPGQPPEPTPTHLRPMPQVDRPALPTRILLMLVLAGLGAVMLSYVWPGFTIITGVVVGVVVMVRYFRHWQRRGSIF